MHPFTAAELAYLTGERPRVGALSDQPGQVGQGLAAQDLAPGVLGPSHGGVDRARQRVGRRLRAGGPALADLGAAEGWLRPVDSLDDIQKRDRLQRAGQAEAALRAGDRFEQAAAHQRLEVGKMHHRRWQAVGRPRRGAPRRTGGRGRPVPRRAAARGGRGSDSRASGCSCRRAGRSRRAGRPRPAPRRGRARPPEPARGHGHAGASARSWTGGISTRRTHSASTAEKTPGSKPSRWKPT